MTFAPDPPTSTWQSSRACSLASPGTPPLVSGVQQFHSFGTLARSLRRYPRYIVYGIVDEPSLGQGVPGLERLLKPFAGYPLEAATSRKGLPAFRPAVAEKRFEVRRVPGPAVVPENIPDQRLRQDYLNPHQSGLCAFGIRRLAWGPAGPRRQTKHGANRFYRRDIEPWSR